MTEANCRRELDLEIPNEEVQKATERVALEIARVSRVPGFRPGKAPVTLIRRRFAEEIKNEVLQSLVPEHIEKAVAEKKMVPVTQPHVDKVDFAEGGALRFRATFEVLPDFALGEYKNLDIELDPLEITEADVEKALTQMRERAATFVPVEGRAIQDGDYAQIHLVGTPLGGGEVLKAENVLCHMGAEETLDAFNENLRGAKVGDHKRFEVHYPADYPDTKLAGKTYTDAIDIVGIKERKLPELNDDFAKDVSTVGSLDELRAQIRKNLEAERDHHRVHAAQEKILSKLVTEHDFPVPDALVEHQMDVRLERAVRSLAAQGVDPRAVNVDWVALRRRQRDRAIEDVKAELVLDRIASAEAIEADEEEIEREIAAVAERSGESANAIRARLTKQAALDRMKSKLRSEKTLEWLYRNSRIRTAAVAES